MITGGGKASPIHALQENNMPLREYLKITDAKAGLEVEIDSGFTCREAGKVLLHADEGGLLWFSCNHGQHFLAGQAQDDYYIGVYPCL
jgi:hypothetical protein